MAYSNASLRDRLVLHVDTTCRGATITPMTDYDPDIQDELVGDAVALGGRNHR